MGKTDEMDSEIVNPNISRLLVILSIIMAFIAPIAFWYYADGGFSFSVIAILWQLYVSNYGIDFYLVSPSMSMLPMFPFLLLRLALPYQLNKYYQNRTTRPRTALAAVLADLPYIVVFLPLIIISIISGGMFYPSWPTPIMMIFGLLVLWRRPMPKAKVPWGEVESTKYWWEEEQSDTPSSNKSKTPW